MSLEDKLNRLFESFGYRRFRMSKFEEYDLYASNKDFLMSSQLITFTDLDGSLLALKPDITLSIIKSTNEARKVYYNEMVYRPRDHHYREIPQAGIECIGKLDSYQEAEVIALAARSLSVIDDNYILRLTDVSFVRALLTGTGIPRRYQNFIIQAMDQKNADYIKSLVKDGILSRKTGSDLVRLIDLYLPLKKGVKEVRTFIRNPECLAMLDHLDEVAGVLAGFGVLDHIRLDFSLVNSMDYYNGLIFQGALSSIPTAVLSGGRYDRLVEKMNKPYSAIGFALYMDVVEGRRLSSRHYDGDILVRYSEKDRPANVSPVINALADRGNKVRAASAADEVHEERWKRVMTLKEAKKEAGL